MNTDQQTQWETTYTGKKNLFGSTPSYPAINAAKAFKKQNFINILELGCGQGRDTLFFAREGFQITALDYSETALAALNTAATESGLTDRIQTRKHDARKPFDFPDNTFDACYSHMLYCMALTTKELRFLSEEICRILKPGALNIYTARHTGDAHYKTGIHRGEDIYEVKGFAVHFFSDEKVQSLSSGYELTEHSTFEEGDLPRKLLYVALKKK